MNKPSHYALWLGALLTTSAAFTAHAQAQSCEADVDCGVGYECKTSTYTACSGGDMGGTGGTGGVGGTTDEPNFQCEEVEYTYCGNATCVTDADCAPTMGCQAQTAWECSAGSAGTGAGGTGFGGEGGAGDCGPEGCMASECYEVPADSVCVPRYQLPCETASDCGGGFDCVEAIYTICSGGGFAGVGGAGGTGGAAGMTAEGGAGGAGDDYSCEEVSSGFYACELQVLPCESTADCPAGLECYDHYEYLPCAVGGSGGSGDTAGTGSGGSGGADEYTCPDPIVALRCQLPGYDGGGMGGSDGGAGSGDGNVGGTGGDSSGGGAAGMSGSAGSGGASEDGDGDGDEGPGKGNGKGRGHGLLEKLLGCSTSGPVSGGSPASGLMMLALGAVILGRRARCS